MHALSIMIGRIPIAPVMNDQPRNFNRSSKLSGREKIKRLANCFFKVSKGVLKGLVRGVKIPFALA